MIKLGIDYGTTTTLLSYSKQGVRYPIPNLIDIGGNRLGYQRSSVPSVIAVTKKNDFSFGYDAEQLAEKFGQDVVLLRSLKRCLSCERQEGQKSVSCLNMANLPHCTGGKKFRVLNKTHSLNDLIGSFLKAVLNQSLKTIKAADSDVNAIGISVPAIFGHTPRHTIFDIILNTIQEKKTIDIINEPTAAINACQNRTSVTEDGVYVICDVGGGTTDIEVFEKTNGNQYFFFKPSGCQVAGDDIDYTILKYLLPNSPVSEQNLREARLAKEQLTVLREVVIFGKKLTRDHFQVIIEPVLFKIIDILRKEIKMVFDMYKPYRETKRNFKLNGIFLSGGGSKIPFLKELIEKDEVISIYGPVVDFIKNNELSKIYKDDLPIVLVALGTSLPKSEIVDAVQRMLPYEIRFITGNRNEIVAPIFSELPLEFRINKSHHGSFRLIAVDPNNPDTAVSNLHDLLSTKDTREVEFSEFFKKYHILNIKIDEYNIMRATAIDAAKPWNRPFPLPWQGGIETTLFEKYRRDWRKKHGYA